MGSLHALSSGSTAHGLHQLLRGEPRERRVFPANAFLWVDGARRVLFDTGYAPLPWRAGIAGRAYRRLLPPTLPPGADIATQLDLAHLDATALETTPSAPRTGAADVTHVVLSHLHPDHVGGLAGFPDATVVVTEGVRRTLARPTIRAGVLDGLLPDGLEPRLQVVPDDAFAVDATTGFRTSDLFGDGSYRLVDLPGHAAGHVGALVEGRVLLAADAAWGRELLGHEARIRPLPRAVAHDALAQAETARLLLDAEAGGLRLVFSHDHHPVGTDLLGAPDGDGNDDGGTE